jgi:hypothetical protein
LPNSLLIGLARPLGDALKRPICCTLQGEDLFLDGLLEPYRRRALELIRRQVPDVDRFIAVSDYYAPAMSRLLGIPSDRVAVVPLGISLKGYERRQSGDDVFRVGYFARIAPEKDCRRSPTPTSIPSRTAGARSGSKRRVISRRPRALPRRREAQSSSEPASRTNSPTAAPSIVRASWRSCARSTSCRCRRPTTSRRVSSCSKPWRPASRRPATSRRLYRSRRKDRRRTAGRARRPVALAEGLPLWHDRQLRDTLGERAFQGCAHYASSGPATDDGRVRAVTKSERAREIADGPSDP